MGARKVLIIKTNDSPKHEPVCMHACEQDIPDSSWKLSRYASMVETLCFLFLPPSFH